MKHSTVRRWLAFLLSAVMLASLLPALSLTAGARDPQKVNASSADELKTYLESSTDYDITLTKSIDKYIDSTDVWCTVRGTKRLDMNGFDVLVHQDGGKTVSYLFRVPADANLTVYDGKTTKTTAKIHYHAEILSGNLVGTIAYWRHLFDIYGKLTINNVMCTAGRVTTRWNYSKAQNVSVQTYGSAAIVHSGGYLEVNGAYLSGHTYLPELSATPVVRVEGNAQLYFNFGEVHGHGAANCFGISNNATVQVSTGIFDSDYYSKVMWGLESQSNRVESPGYVGLLFKHLAQESVPDNDDPTHSSSLKVTAPKLSCGVGVYDGSSTEENGSTSLFVPSENPILHSWFSAPYFHTDVNDSPQAEHIYRVIWEIYDGLTFLADAVKFDNFELNLTKDLQGFTPEVGKPYRVRCTIGEHVRQGITGAACWRYSSITSDYYVQIVDDMLAPVINRYLPASAVFTPGKQLQLSIRASGTNLRYQWYALDLSRPTRPEAISGQTSSTLSISNARETLDGAYIYCVVSNAAGSVRTNYCKLGKEQTVITEIPLLNLDQPRHGVPLDTDVDIGVPGVALVSAQWSVISPKLSGLLPMSEAEINNPIAGQRPILSIVVAYDKNVVIDKSTKLTALGLSTTYAEQNGNLFTFNLSGFTVAADGPLEIDLASLSFNNKDLEIGETAPTLDEKNCGFSDLGLLAKANSDIRYSIQSRKWFVDNVETENPIVEEDHTYTLKVRLQSEPGWVITDDTTILVDGEEVHFTVESVRVGKDIVTCADFGLKYSTKGDADDEGNVYDIWVGGLRVTDANRRDVLSDGGSVRYDPALNTLTLTNAEISGAPVPEWPDFSTGVYCPDDLTLELVGRNTVTASGSNDGNTGILVESLLTVLGPGSLNVTAGKGVTSAGVSTEQMIMRGGAIDARSAGATSDSAGVFSNDLIVEGGTLVGIAGAALRSWGIDGWATIKGGSVIAAGQTRAFYSQPELSDYADPVVTVNAKPSENGASAWNGTDALGDDNSSFKYVSIQPGSYDIWVGGVQVTKANRGDVLSDGGSVKYDPASNTLTLTNARISGASIPIDPRTTSGILSDIDLTLELVGNNFVTGMDARDSSYGILLRFSRNLVLAGSGTLDVTSGSGRGNSAISATRITMLSGTIRASGAYASETSSSGISCSDLTVEGGALTAFGGEYPNSRGISGIVNVNRGTVTAIGEISALNAAPSLPPSGSIVMVSTEPSADNARAWNGTDSLGGDGSSFKYVKIALLNPFIDVPEGQYYFEPVMWAVNHTPQITNGTSATTFGPDRTCTRAQVVTFLWRAMGEPEPTKTDNPFTDVAQGQYYYKAVLWAVEKGITTGTSATTFSPDSGCTRGQVVTFLWRAEGQPEPASTNNPFTDVQEGQYYYKAVLWAVEKDITKGTSPDKFSPNSTCTRGQIVTFLYRDLA